MTRLISRILPALLLLGAVSWLQAQTPAPQPPASAPATTPSTAPLPDIPTLMREVESRERKAETVEKDYIYRESSVVDELDGHGAVKKTRTREFDIFWLDGVNVRKLVKKDGKDLTPDELQKESERIDKMVAEAHERRAKADAKGKETDSHGHDEITVSRMLELGAFTNARREQVAGRDTIAVDFTGDPKAKTRNPGEAAIHDMAGTVWIDEVDKSLTRIDGRFIHPFKIGGVLVVDVKQDTSYSIRFRKINSEVWLPEGFDAHGHARILLFTNFDGNIHVHDGDYRKFRASATLLPGLTQVDDAKPTEAKPSDTPPASKP